MADWLTNQRLTRWLPMLVVPPILLLDGFLAQHQGSLTPIAVPVAVLAALPLVFADRIGTVGMLVMITLGTVMCMVVFAPINTVSLLPAWGLFNLARAGGTRRTVIIAISVVPIVFVSVYVLAQDKVEGLSIAFGSIALCELALGAGYLFWYKAQLFERTHAQRLGEERLRIAREVHDTVAHAMVAINVQSGVAAHLLNGDNEQARTALRNIKQTSGDALTDLRATLGILRDPDQAAPEGPAASLEDLDTVAEHLRASGVSVSVDVDTGGPVPAPIEGAVFRIVQEALTNVLRHASAAHAEVAVTRDGDDLKVSVSDDGAGGSRNGGSPGVGLRGMKERSAALGGTLHAGPAPGGGWGVDATLPLKGIAA